MTDRFGFLSLRFCSPQTWEAFCVFALVLGWCLRSGRALRDKSQPFSFRKRPPDCSPSLPPSTLVPAHSSPELVSKRVRGVREGRTGQTPPRRLHSLLHPWPWRRGLDEYGAPRRERCPSQQVSVFPENGSSASHGYGRTAFPALSGGGLLHVGAGMAGDLGPLLLLSSALPSLYVNGLRGASCYSPRFTGGAPGTQEVADSA